MNKEELKKLLKENLKIRYDVKDETILVNNEMGWKIRHNIVNCVIEFDGEDICSAEFRLNKR